MGGKSQCFFGGSICLSCLLMGDDGCVPLLKYSLGKTIEMIELDGKLWKMMWHGTFYGKTWPTHAMCHKIGAGFEV